MSPRSWGEWAGIYLYWVPLAALVCLAFGPLIVGEKIVRELEARGWKRRNLVGHGQRPVKR